jgi:Tfp pilus assembly protein PilO
MPLNPEQKRTLALILIVGIIGLAAMTYYWFVFGTASVAASAKEKDEVEAKLKAVNEDLDKIAAFETMTAHEYTELEEMIAKVSKVLPQSRHAEEFFIALRDILSKTGISTQRLTPEVPAEYERFAEIPYSIKASGRYHDFGTFLSLVEQNPERFMRLKTLKLTNDPAHPSFHLIEIGVSTFMLKNEPIGKVPRKRK